MRYITISIAAGWDLKLVRPVQMLIKEYVNFIDKTKLSLRHSLRSPQAMKVIRPPENKWLVVKKCREYDCQPNLRQCFCYLQPYAPINKLQGNELIVHRKPKNIANNKIFLVLRFL